MRALGLLTLLSLTRIRALREGNDSTRSFRGGGLTLGRDCDAACRSDPHRRPAPTKKNCSSTPPAWTDRWRFACPTILLLQSRELRESQLLDQSIVGSNGIDICSQPVLGRLYDRKWQILLQKSFGLRSAQY